MVDRIARKSTRERVIKFKKVFRHWDRLIPKLKQLRFKSIGREVKV